VGWQMNFLGELQSAAAASETIAAAAAMATMEKLGKYMVREVDKYLFKVKCVMFGL